MTKLELIYLAGGFAAGVVVGTVTTWTVIRNKKKKNVAEEIAVGRQEDVDRVREGRYEIIAAAREKLSESAGERKLMSQYFDMTSQYGGEAPRDLESYLAEREHPEDDSEDTATEEDRDIYEGWPGRDDEEGPPYPISEDDFSSNRHDYEKLFLRYYLGDKALCDDESEELVADPDGYIGVKIDMIPPGRLLWFRVPDASCDVEITVYSGSYHEEVLGMTNKEWATHGGLEGYLAETE